MIGKSFWIGLSRENNGETFKFDNGQPNILRSSTFPWMLPEPDGKTAGCSDSSSCGNCVM